MRCDRIQPTERLLLPKPLTTKECSIPSFDEFWLQQYEHQAVTRAGIGKTMRNSVVNKLWM
jgi:hypothetical protein